MITELQAPSTTSEEKELYTPTTWSTDLARYEDGQRVEVTDQTFEWWYFDTILSDGSTCVVTFLNKIPFQSCPLLPILQLNISTPAGHVYQKEAVFHADQYSASRDKCRVTMGSKNGVEGDLQTYHLHAEYEDKESGYLCADLDLTTVVPGWRMGPYLPPQVAAQQWLGEQVVIASGTVTGTLTYGGQTRPVKGTCYHDHQWGGGAQTAGPVKVTSWYWGRTCIGDHSIVFAQVLGSDGSGPERPIAAMFLLARGGRVTYSDDPAALSVVPLGSGIEMQWKSNQGTVTLQMPSKQQIASFPPDGSHYLRYLSDARLESDFAGEIFRSEGKAIWEFNKL